MARMSEPVPILSVHNLHKVYLERVILDDVTFTISEGERVALLGANGAGKSTLLSILASKLPPDGGEVRQRRDTTIAYLDQSGNLFDDWTVGRTIDSAFETLRQLQRELDEVHDAFEKPFTDAELVRLLKRQESLSHTLEHHDLHTVESRKAEAMAALGVPQEDRLIGQLSGGERRRVALCRTLLEDPDLLLLDEPTNHLDAETLDWLEDFLARFAGTVIFVTHDRYFLDNVATKMIELARGVARIYPGNYTDYLDAKQIEDERATRNEATRQNLMKREIEWLRRQPKARTTKSKARIDRADALIASKPMPPDGSMQLLIPTGPRLGKTLVEGEKLTHSMAGRKLIDNFTFTLGPGDRVGVVGRNGLGKTTLLRILMKDLQPDGGTVKHGINVKFVYADQNRTSLDPEKTVLQEVAGDLDVVQVGDQKIGFRTWLARFLFNENTAAMPIKLLSGGERNRVQLAKMMREGGNVVVLDEPTNDLDLPTLRILEEALVNFDGCAFVVSHDRYFLNRVANRIIAFRSDGQILIIAGNYDHYRAYCEREAAAEDAAKAAAAPPKPDYKSSSKAAAGAVATAPKKKLSFNEQRELDGIEKQIEVAEKKLAEADAKLADPTTFTKMAKDKSAKLVADQAAAKQAVDKLYERWTELGEKAKG